MRSNNYSGHKTLASRLLGLLLVGLLCLQIPLLSAANDTNKQAPSSQRLLLLVSKNSSIYQNVTHTLEKELQTQELQFDTYYLPNSPERALLDQYDLVISVGTLATQKAMELGQFPILSTFIPRRTYQALIKRNPGLEERQQQGQVSALYLEQPFHRQLQLLSLIKPNVEKLATILGPASKQELTQLEQAASQMQWQLNLKQLSKNDNPVELLSPLIKGSDAFLAIPDKSIFNRSTAKWILLMTFRQRIPLIAYSKRYVDAGAVAGIFSTPQSVGQETAELVVQWLQTGRLSPPTHPKQFDISVNRATARSLRLKLPPLNMLKKQLEEQ